MTNKEFEILLQSAKELRERKNADYGDDFLKTYNNLQKVNAPLGNIVIYFDLNRKFKRLEKILLTGEKEKVLDETIEDTLMDMAIMSLNAIIALREREKNRN